MWLIKILLMALFLVFLVQNNNDLVSFCKDSYRINSRLYKT